MAKQQTELKRINISEIKNPTFLKDLSYKELDLFSSDLNSHILNCVSKTGGHLSSNLGVIDSTIALCRVFDFTKDKIIFDVGHQTYAYKVLTGRSLSTLRQKNGTSGFQKVKESPYDHFECGHSSTSISVAEGMATARDKNKDNYEVIAYIGDGSIANGLAMEALNNLSPNGHKVIIVFNDNDMSITKYNGAFQKTFRSISNSLLYRKSKSTFQRFFKVTLIGRGILKFLSGVKNFFRRHLLSENIFDLCGISYIGVVDGHNIKAMEKAFNHAKKMNNSVAIHIKTIKGKGYKLAEDDNVGNWHAVNPFDIETGKPINKNPNFTSWSVYYSTLIDKALEEDKKRLLIVPATQQGSSLLDVFNKYPEQCVDVGISEEHAVTFSGGLSISGYHPIICEYSTFLQRAYDEIIHDLARMDLNATLLIDRSGFTGSDGDTHMGIYDEQFLLGIPGVSLSFAARPSEAQALVKESFNNHGVFAIRYPKTSFQNENVREESIKFGSWKTELDSGTTAIISIGPLTVALKQEIIKQGKKATLINAIYQKPYDLPCLMNLLQKEKIIIYDAYSTEAGFAQMISSKLMELGYKGKLIIRSIPMEYIKQASIFEQLQYYKLLPVDIVNLI